jgi:hypothetical protein
MLLLNVIALSLALAFLTESMVEYLFGTLADHVPALGAFRWALMYIAAAVGVGLALYYRLDLLALIAEDAPTNVGMVLTGLIVGHGANYLHQFVSKYLPGPRQGQAKAVDIARVERGG